MTQAWAEVLQGMGTPFTDGLAYIVTSLGSEGFFTVTLPVIYWVWGRKAGFRIAFLYLVSACVNFCLKDAFKLPRPPETPRAKIMHPETGPGYAFPSGHAQGSTVFWGQVAIESRRKGMWAFAAVLIFLVSMSRIYMNLHWPTDIVGGILIGLVLLRAFNVFYTAASAVTVPFALALTASLGIPLAFLAAHTSQDVRLVSGLLLGWLPSRVLEARFIRWNERASRKDHVIKSAVGLLVLGALRFGLKAAFPQQEIFDVVRYIVMGIWVGLGAPYIFKVAGLERSSEEMKTSGKAL